MSYVLLCLSHRENGKRLPQTHRFYGWGSPVLQGQWGSLVLRLNPPGLRDSHFVHCSSQLRQSHTQHKYVACRMVINESVSLWPCRPLTFPSSCMMQLSEQTQGLLLFCHLTSNSSTPFLSFQTPTPCARTHSRRPSYLFPLSLISQGFQVKTTKFGLRSCKVGCVCSHACLTSCFSLSNISTQPYAGSRRLKTPHTCKQLEGSIPYATFILWNLSSRQLQQFRRLRWQSKWPKWRLAAHHSTVKIAHASPLRSPNSNVTGTRAHTHPVLWTSGSGIAYTVPQRHPCCPAPQPYPQEVPRYLSSIRGPKHSYLILLKFFTNSVIKMSVNDPPKTGIWGKSFPF